MNHDSLDLVLRSGLLYSVHPDADVSIFYFFQKVSEIVQYLLLVHGLITDINGKRTIHRIHAISFLDDHEILSI